MKKSIKRILIMLIMVIMATEIVLPIKTFADSEIVAYETENGDVDLSAEAKNDNSGSDADDFSETEKSDSDTASLIENIISKMFLIVGAGLYLLVCFAIGEPFSIESVLFNKYSNTQLGFFSGSATNNFLENSGIKDILNDFYSFFTGIAIAVYLVVLVYIGLKILISSTAEKGAKHKQLLLYWVEGVAILFLFPYVMKYAININNAFVEFVYANKSEYYSADENPTMYAKKGTLRGAATLISDIIAEIDEKGDYMSEMFSAAWNYYWFVYVVCWYVMFFQMVGFLIIYFKRMLMITFLIAIFPLVMISYALDKIGDGKSQAFGNWAKEFLLNVFIQSFHVIAYVIVMSLITEFMDDPSDNWLLIIISLTYIAKGDDILRGIFSLTSSADTVKGLGATIMETAAISKFAGSARKIGSKVIGGPKKVFNALGVLSQHTWDHRENKAKQELNDYESSRLNVEMPQSTPETPAQKEKNMRADIEKLLNRNKENLSEEEIRKAADRLLGYINDPANDELRSKIEAELNLSDSEKELLDNLLSQNAAVNKLMVGGREVNINQEIDVILTNLRRDKDGNLTKESRALLAKIGKSEADLKTMKMIGDVKFKKLDDRERRAKRRNEDRSTRIQGRGAARNRTDREKARNSIEYNQKRKAMSEKKIQTATERAMERTGRATSSQGSTSRRKTELTRKKSPWQNVESVTGSAGLETAKHGAAAQNNSSKKKTKVTLVQSSGKKTAREKRERNDAISRVTKYGTSNANASSSNASSGTTSYGNKIPEKKVVSSAMDSRAHTVRELQAIRKQKLEEMRAERNKQGDGDVRNSTAFKVGVGGQKEDTTTLGASAPSANANSSASTRQNVGAEIANKSGSADELLDVLYVSEASTIFDEKPRRPKKEQETSGSEKKKDEDADRDTSSSKGMFSYDKNRARRCIEILANASSGKYTAEEILACIAELKEIGGRYEGIASDESTEIKSILGGLGYNLQDYESLVRVKILNNPDSVGNDSEIIQESVAYVKDTEMPSLIKDRLAYTEEQLGKGADLRYVKKKDTEYSGFMSEEQKSASQREYEEKLRFYELQLEREKLEQERNDKFKVGNYARDVGRVALSVAEAAYDISTTAASVGTGFITTGLATDGKSEIITQATTNLFAGYSIGDSFAETVKGPIKGVPEKLFPKDEEKDSPIRSAKFPSDPIEYYGKRTEYKGRRFSEKNDN